MEVVNQSELLAFARTRANARPALNNWLRLTKSVRWRSFADVRETFRSADYVNNQVVFDIGGNNYRLICSIDYTKQRIRILEVMTHAQYDRWKA